MSAYRVHYVLPAMCIADAVTVGPATFCTSAHLNQYSIDPPEDARSIALIAANYAPAYGRGTGRIGLMLLPAAHQAALERDGIPRMCRDALAMSYITRGTALCCHHGQSTTVHNADYFEALPIRLRGDGFILQRPGLRGITHHLKHYKPALPTYLSEQSDGDFQIDDLLLRDLTRAIEVYRRGSKRRSLRQVFRAIAIGLHATRIMAETDSTHFDLGVRITSWASAFEALVHPGTGQIGILQVLDLIRPIKWTGGAPAKGWVRMQVAPLARKRFVIKVCRPPVRDGAASHLYWRLYQLRNAVAHGNRIRPADFAARTGQRRGPRIDEVAPLLFRECILERLRQIGVVRRAKNGPIHHKATLEYIQERLLSSGLHEALEKALLGQRRRRRVQSTPVPSTKPITYAPS